MLTFNKINLFANQASNYFELDMALVESRSTSPFSPSPRRWNYLHRLAGRSGPAKLCSINQ